MEALAFLSLLAVGAAASQYTSPSPPKQVDKKTKEGFESGSQRGSDQPYRVRRAPVAPVTGPTGELDIQYQLPTGGSVSMEPHPSDIQGFPTNYATQYDSGVGQAFGSSASPAPQQPISSISPMVMQRDDGMEVTPNYSRQNRVISPLSGVELDSSELDSIFENNNANLIVEKSGNDENKIDEEAICANIMSANIINSNAESICA